MVLDASTQLTLTSITAEGIANSPAIVGKYVDPSFGQCKVNFGAAKNEQSMPVIDLVTPELIQNEKSRLNSDCDSNEVLVALLGGSGGSGGVTADIDTDSDNALFLEHSVLEESVEMSNPGNVIHINWNDDDSNGVADYNQTSPQAFDDTDLEVVTLDWQSGGTNPAGYIFELSKNNNNVKVWTTQRKDQLVNMPTSWSISQNPGLVFVEGMSFGQTILTWRVRSAPNGPILAEDQVLVTVSEADAMGFRPQTEAYGAPFPRTPVPSIKEMDPGIGIRRNGNNVNSNLIEVELTAPTLPGIKYILGRTAEKYISVWANSDKTGPLLTASGADEVQLPAAGASNKISVWVEWTKLGTAEEHSYLYIDLRTSTANPQTNNVTVKTDTLQFYPFRSIVYAFGGFQSVPIDPSSGAYVMAKDLYEDGYDVHALEGTSANVVTAFSSIKTAVEQRGVSQVALFGHSFGGAATYEVSYALAGLRAGFTPPNKPFTLNFTAYIDAIVLNTTYPLTTPPPLTLYHVNYYETIDTNLHGAPSTTGVNVNVNNFQWGSGLIHTNIDDNSQVRGRILDGFDGPQSSGPLHSGLRDQVSR